MTGALVDALIPAMREAFDDLDVRWHVKVKPGPGLDLTVEATVSSNKRTAVWSWPTLESVQGCEVEAMHARLTAERRAAEVVLELERRVQP